MWLQLEKTKQDYSPDRYLHSHVHSSMMHSNQKVETDFTLGSWKFLGMDHGDGGDNANVLNTTEL